jgi:hypothetical protein
MLWSVQNFLPKPVRLQTWARPFSEVLKSHWLTPKRNFSPLLLIFSQTKTWLIISYERTQAPWLAANLITIVKDHCGYEQRNSRPEQCPPQSAFLWPRALKALRLLRLVTSTNWPVGRPCFAI